MLYIIEVIHELSMAFLLILLELRHESSEPFGRLRSLAIRNRDDSGPDKPDVDATEVVDVDTEVANRVHDITTDKDLFVDDVHVAREIGRDAADLPTVMSMASKCGHLLLPPRSVRRLLLIFALW